MWSSQENEMSEAARPREGGCTYRILVGKPEAQEQLKDLSVDERIILI